MAYEARFFVTRMARLTDRERHVLQLLVEGHSRDDIAGELGITAGRLAGIRQGIRRKLAVPPEMDLVQLFEAIPGLAQLLYEAPEVETDLQDDRRSRLTLRAAIRDLELLIKSSRERADALDVIAADGGADDVSDDAALVRDLTAGLIALQSEIVPRARKQTVDLRIDQRSRQT